MAKSKPLDILLIAIFALDIPKVAVFYNHYLLMTNRCNFLEWEKLTVLTKHLINLWMKKPNLVDTSRCVVRRGSSLPEATKSRGEIAPELATTLATVKREVSRILTVLNVSSRKEAVSKARAAMASGEI